MSPPVFVILYIVVAGGVTVLLYHLLPRRWSDSIRVIVANWVVNLASWGLFAIAPAGFPSFDIDSAASLVTLLLAPQQVVALICILRAEERRPSEPNGSEPAASADASRPDPDRTLPLDPDGGGSAPAGRNAFRRYWTGDYPLGVTFWGLGSIGSSLASLPNVITQFLELEPSISETAFMISWVAGYAFFVVAAGYLFIGSLRSARRRVKERQAIGRRAFWARVALVYDYGGLLVTAVNLGLVGFVAYVLLAIAHDPTLPDFASRVMRSGTEMEVTGGFRPGLAREVARVLRDNPTVRVVHLESPGGLELEGDRLFRLIRRKSLDTYVADFCASACTVAFVGGKERWIDRNAKIGFHKADADRFGELVGRIAGPLVGANLISIYQTAGVDPIFIAKALATPNDSLLIPKPWELLAAKVATRVAGDGRFAVSGLGSDPTSADFLTALSRMFPILHPISDGWEDDYDNLLNDIVDGWRSGLTRNELTALVDDRTAELAATELADTDAATIAQVVRLWADTFATLATSDPSRCRILAAGRKNEVTRLPASDLLADRRGALVRHLIVDHTADFQGMETKRYERGREAFFAAIRRDLGDDVANRLSKPPTEVDAAVLCATWKSVLERVPSWDREIGLAVAWRFGL